uniref:hypothetical protein n=1 Tax=Acetatifactor sp. TaxID=1872090 RepID=UPI00405648D6
MMAVSTVGKLKRDENKSNNSIVREKDTKGKNLFSQMLEAEVAERKTTDVTCRNVTYGQDSRIHTFEYRTREYHY